MLRQSWRKIASIHSGIFVRFRKHNAACFTCAQQSVRMTVLHNHGVQEVEHLVYNTVEVWGVHSQVRQVRINSVVQPESAFTYDAVNKVSISLRKDSNHMYLVWSIWPPNVLYIHVKRTRYISIPYTYHYICSVDGYAASGKYLAENLFQRSFKIMRKISRSLSYKSTENNNPVLFINLKKIDSFI